MAPLPKLLTMGEAADHFGVNVATVRRWAKTGRIRHAVMPSGQIRFRIEDLDEAVQQVEPQPKASAS